ncbi:MAG: polysaccharide deacetylase family protein [bacterium]|nr:polysaccharide deacetylase family protein [bacterium]
MAPVYIAAYDTENPTCLDGVRRIVEVHENYDMPATFFMVAGLLDSQRDEYVALLRDHPLFEIACHTYSHAVLVDTPSYGKAVPVDAYHRELTESKQRLEDVFGCEVAGLRPAVGCPDGLVAHREALDHIAATGYTYTSSALWGPQFSLPAPLRSPFAYAEQGRPDLWEIPSCGWHENLLKGNNKTGPLLLCLFPPDMPEAIPPGLINAPEEELQYNNRPFIDRAIAQDASHVTLTWHPWSLHRFDPEMRMLELTFDYVLKHELPVATFSDLAAECRSGSIENGQGG